MIETPSLPKFGGAIDINVTDYVDKAEETEGSRFEDEEEEHKVQTWKETI